MLEKTPVQQCLSTIAAALLAGITFWLALLVRASFMVRDTTMDHIMVHVGPLDLSQIERTTGSVRITLEQGTIPYLMCWAGVGIIYYMTVRAARNHLSKRR